MDCCYYDSACVVCVCVYVCVVPITIYMTLVCISTLFIYGYNPLFFQSTFLGRLRHFLDIIDPLTLLTTKVTQPGVT